MNIFELMERHNYNFVDECVRIKNLIETSKYTSYSQFQYNLIYAINEATINWKYNKLRYSYWDFVKKYGMHPLNKTNALLYLEFIFNIIYYSDDIWQSYNAEKIINNISSIIHNLLSQFNKKFKQTDEKIIIIENNNIVTEVIKDINDKEYALALLQYQNVTIKDNVVEKEKLLTIISKNILPFIDKYREKQYKNNQEFYKIADDLSCMLNNFHIRHNNKDGKDEKPFIHTLSNNKKIEYLDTIYNLILLLQQVENYNTIYADKVSELKKSI